MEPEVQINNQGCASASPPDLSENLRWPHGDHFISTLCQDKGHQSKRLANLLIGYKYWMANVRSIY